MQLPRNENYQTGDGAKLNFARLASGLGLNYPSRASGNGFADNNTSTVQTGVLESLTRGLVDSSMSAVKAVQVKARHIVSQNKRRYQEGGFDLDMTYITENIIAMGFPAGDMSSGFFGYVEGLYRNHMEEVINFFETHHKGKYKVYNLCSERLYDASLFEGKVASFPFDDHNCPPIQLITSFCRSAYSWLKEDIVNVVVVHCKAGMARTGLMITCFLLFLKFFTTAEECIDYYNQKRCVDGKGLILPSQIRYVKYFERLLTYFDGEIQPGRRCILRGFRLHGCPYWVRPAITISNHNGVLFSTRKHPKTKDLMPEDFWMRAPKKGIVVFALPGEPGLTELMGDFKIQFHDRQGDFYCWLNTTMMENRTILKDTDIDGFDKRKLPSPGFELEIVMIDYGATKPRRDNEADDDHGRKKGSSSSCDGKSSSNTTSAASLANRDQSKSSSGKKDDNDDDDDDDDVFSDSDDGEIARERSGQSGTTTTTTREQNERLSVGRSNEEATTTRQANGSSNSESRRTERLNSNSNMDSSGSSAISDFKAIAADASVFTFGDEEEDDYDEI